MKIPPLAIAIGGAGLLAASPPTQSPPEDVLWAVQASPQRRALAIDPFGEIVRAVNVPPVDRLLRAPDGLLWGLGATGDVLLFERDAAFRARVPLPSAPIDLAFDAGGHGWAVVATGPALIEVRPNGTVGRTRPLLGRPFAMIVDAFGGIVVAQQGAPGATVTRFDPVSNATAAVTLPGPFVEVLDLAALPDGRVLVAARDAVLGELAPGLSLTRTAAPPIRAPLRHLAQRDGATILVATDDVLYEIDSASLRFRPVWNAGSGLTDLAVDARGAVWVTRGNDVLRLTPDYTRPDLTRSFPARPALEQGLRRRAVVVAPLADDDGDGTANGVEVRLGTNPVDAQSRPAASLSTPRVTWRQNDDVTFDIGGLGGRGLLLFAGDQLLGRAPIPGIAGAPRLDPASLLPVGLPIGVPGRATLRVPDDPILAGVKICAQAVVGITNPRFTDHACIRLDRAALTAVVDGFMAEAFLFRERSAARATGGRLTPTRVGGTGALGEFHPEDGVRLEPDVFEWSTDDQLVRAERTLEGRAIRVTDGRFAFQSFVIPSGTTVRFVGSNPLILDVAGTFEVDGVLDLSGVDVEGGWNAKNSQAGPPFVPGAGQPGSRGGPGAGSGGDGAFGCDGSGNPQQPRFHDFGGFPGDDLQVPAGHAYAAQAPGTGGRGGALFPVHGDEQLLRFSGFGNIYAVEAGGAGGGGGYRGAGSDGEILEAGYIAGSPPNVSDRGPPTPGGAALPSLLPLPTGTTSLEHFLIGGSGGGGGGSQPLFANRNGTIDPFKFRSGAGGAGGGGALVLRVGREFLTGPAGEILLRGGSCAPTATLFSVIPDGVPAPGGGGSGGTLLVQTDGTTNPRGRIDVRGGQGATTDLNGFFACDLRGGDGAAGYARLESTQAIPGLRQLGTVLPPARPGDVDRLVDRDDRAMALLGTYTIRRPPTQEPELLHYEVTATIAGRAITFSDDLGAFLPANVPGQPVRLRFRAVRVDSSLGPWRDFVNPRVDARLRGDSPEGVQVLVEFDRRLLRDAWLDELRIVLRN